MIANSRRSGFTLVEMLVVLGVIATVAAIFIPIALNMSDRNQVPKGASMVENSLSLAKARAIAEKRPNGIRLVLAPDNLRNTTTANVGYAWYNEIQYIEVPSDFIEHWVWGLATAGVTNVAQPYWSIRRGASNLGQAAPAPGVLPWGIDSVNVAAGPVGPGSFQYDAYVDTGTTIQTNRVVPRNRMLFGPISFANWTGQDPFPKLPQVAGDLLRPQRLEFSFSGPPANIPPYPVQVGDRVEITGVGELYTVISVSRTGVDIGQGSSVNVSVLELDRPLSQNILPPVNGRSNYRVIRQARPIPALSPMKLPQDVVIDVTPSRFAMVGAGADLDTTGNAWMSNVSLGVNLRTVTIGPTTYKGISTLTDPAAPTPLVAPPYIDILFSPSGEILPTGQEFNFTTPNRLAGFNVGSSGLIALWLHSRGDPNLWAARQITAAQGNADNQAIVAINGRTGFIGSYPINRSTADPLANARIGKARISADTGQ